MDHASLRTAIPHPPISDDIKIGHQLLFERLPQLFASFGEEQHKQERDAVIAHCDRKALPGDSYQNSPNAGLGHDFD